MNSVKLSFGVDIDSDIVVENVNLKGSVTQNSQGIFIIIEGRHCDGDPKGFVRLTEEEFECVRLTVENVKSIYANKS